MTALPTQPHPLKFFLLPLAWLALTSAAAAQQPAPGNAPASVEAPPGMEELNEPGISRQEIREEMQKIREEHENLEIQHDQLRTQCLNAKGQERTACHQKWEALEQQKEALHTRIRALHERLVALRDQQHPQNHAMNNPPNNRWTPSAGGAAAPVPAPNADGAVSPPVPLPPAIISLSVAVTGQWPAADCAGAP